MTEQETPLSREQIEEWRTKIKGKIWGDYCATPQEEHGRKLMQDFDALCDMALRSLEASVAQACPIDPSAVLEKLRDRNQNVGTGRPDSVFAEAINVIELLTLSASPAAPALPEGMVLVPRALVERILTTMCGPVVERELRALLREGGAT